MHTDSVDYLITRLSQHTKRLPLRIIDENTSDPLDKTSGAYVVHVAYENDVVYVVTRDEASSYYKRQA